MKNFLGKYQSQKTNGTNGWGVTVTVGITEGGKINLDWDYTALHETNCHVVLRWINEHSPLMGLPMGHTGEDMDMVVRAIRQAKDQRDRAQYWAGKIAYADAPGSLPQKP